MKLLYTCQTSRAWVMRGQMGSFGNDIVSVEPNVHHSKFKRKCTVRKIIQENMGHKLQWLCVSDAYNIALFISKCSPHFILRTVNGRMVANDGGQSRTHCQISGFPVEIRKRNPFHKHRELPMGEAASAIQFWKVNFYCAYIKMATLRSAELGTTFTVFLMCMVLDLQRCTLVKLLTRTTKIWLFSGKY